MRFVAALVLIVLSCAGCHPKRSERSSQTVAAYEIAVPTAGARAKLLSILRQAAKAAGGHLDASSDEELAELGRDMPQAKMTVHAAVWRGSTDEETWAVIMDQSDHLGRVWLMFLRGEDEAAATRFRNSAMANVRANWKPLSLPVIENRSIPLSRDMIRTPDGYRLNPSAASRYAAK
ncbi:hypothetical protein [Novosphingobium sp. 9]|uniref:hypothetical protein n=1 Tax=Novosphingobium sp. 9 TaxID=2025349 RepID=UPI0021B4F447|nr:hypothetical protein [Novosphingobium sp. 9]